MGLDVYLYRCKDAKGALEFDKAEEARHDAIYEEMKKDPEWAGKDNYGNPSLSIKGFEEYRRRCKADSKKHPRPPEFKEKEIRLKSEVHPEHYFNIGYFRSSYNESGTNSVLRAAVGKDLYYIFGGSFQEMQYHVFPDWKASLERAKEVRAEFAKHLEEAGEVRIVRARINSFRNLSELPADTAAVMKIFKEQQLRHNAQYGDPKANTPFSSKDYNWYSNGDGDFFLGKGAQLLAAIPMKSIYLDEKSPPDIALVIRDDDAKPGEKKPNVYLTSLDIVIETIEYVLRHRNINEFYFHWSG